MQQHIAYDHKSSYHWSFRFYLGCLLACGNIAADLHQNRRLVRAFILNARWSYEDEAHTGRSTSIQSAFCIDNTSAGPTHDTAQGTCSGDSDFAVETGSNGQSFSETEKWNGNDPKRRILSSTTSFVKFLIKNPKYLWTSGISWVFQIGGGLQTLLEMLYGRCTAHNQSEIAATTYNLLNNV